MELTSKEKEKYQIIQDCIDGKLTKSQAAVMLGISPRQIKRLKAKVREEGQEGVVHGLKEKTSNHHISQDIKQEALQTIKKQYADFKPTFAAEKLAENHGIVVNRETTRLWMIEEKLWKPRKQKQGAYYSWRARKEYLGELE